MPLSQLFTAYSEQRLDRMEQYLPRLRNPIIYKEQVQNSGPLFLGYSLNFFSYI